MKTQDNKNSLCNSLIWASALIITLNALATLAFIGGCGHPLFYLETYPLRLLLERSIDHDWKELEELLLYTISLSFSVIVFTLLDYFLRLRTDHRIAMRIIILLTLYFLYIGLHFLLLLFFPSL